MIRIKRNYYVHRGGYNVTQALVGVDLAKKECRDWTKKVVWEKTKYGTWYPVKIRGRCKDEIFYYQSSPKNHRLTIKIKGKRYTFNPEKFRRNIIILCVSFFGIYMWFLVWFLWARGVTN